MTAVGLRQLSMLILTGGMVVVGALGLAEIVTPGPILAAALLVAAIVLAVDIVVSTENNVESDTQKYLSGILAGNAPLSTRQTGCFDGDTGFYDIERLLRYSTLPDPDSIKVHL